MCMTERQALPYQNSTILQGCRIIWLATEIDCFCCKPEDVSLELLKEFANYKNKTMLAF